MFDCAFLNSVKYPVLVIDSGSGAVCGLNKPFRELFYDELSKQEDKLPQFLEPIISKILACMAELEAIVLTQDISVNGEAKPFKIKCQYADSTRSQIVAVFELGSEKAIMPFEWHVVGVINDAAESAAASEYYDKAIALWSLKQDASMAAIAINVNSGTVISGRSKLLSCLNLVGFEGKEYSREFLKNIVNNATRERIKNDLMPQSLINAYREGRTHFSYEVEMNLNGSREWLKMSGELYRNPKTGDLIALFRWVDINKIKLRQKINRLLLYKEYDFICCIFAKTGSYTVVSASEISSIIARSAPGNYEEIVNSAVEKCGDEADKGYLKFSFSLKNLLSQLSAGQTYSFVGHGKYPDGTPFVKLNSFSYLDRDKQIILYTRKDITSKTNVLSFKSGNSVCSVPYCDIVYVESFGKKSTIVTIACKYDVKEMLTTIQERLPGREFMRCHRCYIVRCSSIRKIDKYTATLSNGEEISVSRNSVERLRERIHTENSIY